MIVRCETCNQEYDEKGTEHKCLGSIHDRLDALERQSKRLVKLVDQLFRTLGLDPDDGRP